MPLYIDPIFARFHTIWALYNPSVAQALCTVLNRLCAGYRENGQVDLAALDRISIPYYDLHTGVPGLCPPER